MCAVPLRKVFDEVADLVEWTHPVHSRPESGSCPWGSLWVRVEGCSSRLLGLLAAGIQPADRSAAVDDLLDALRRDLAALRETYLLDELAPARFPSWWAQREAAEKALPFGFDAADRARLVRTRDELSRLLRAAEPADAVPNPAPEPAVAPPLLSPENDPPVPAADDESVQPTSAPWLGLRIEGDGKSIRRDGIAVTVDLSRCDESRRRLVLALVKAKGSGISRETRDAILRDQDGAARRRAMSDLRNLLTPLGVTVSNGEPWALVAAKA